MSTLLIKSAYNGLSRSEKKIADYVLTHHMDIVYMPITEFAEKCRVGDATALRFCRKLGFRGYQDFKLALARDNAEAKKVFNDDISQDDSIEVIIGKLKINNIRAIEDTINVISVDAVEKAAEKIIGADRIEIFGTGASTYTAGDLEYKFLRIGIYCRALNNTHLQIMAAANLSKKSIAIGISFSGSTNDTADALEIAKQNGAFTIAITNFMKSPITKHADAVLLTSAKETPLRGGALTSKIAQLVVMDILYTAVASKMGQKAYDNINRTADAVVSKLY